MSDTLPEAGGRIRALVAAHIEPVTRFDAADLNEVSPEQTYPVALELTVNQQVSFGIGRQVGAARLPGGIEKVAGKAAFEAELGQRLTRANTEVPTAVQNWAQANPGSYRRLMSPRAGFLREPGTIGYEHTCTTCAGACRVTCPTCVGKGRTTCLGCHGAGKLNCHRCHGSKKLSCSSCNGRGSWSEQVSESTWSHATNSYVTSYRTEYRSCIACSSSGHTSCHSCGYDGKVPCMSCGGQGHINCMRCNTTGKVNCSACVASGIQHVRGTIEARVTHTEQLGIATEAGRLHDLIGTLPRESLPDFGALTQVQHTPQGRTLQTRHTLRLDVHEARLQAGQEDFTLYGFGPQAQVLSFENIAGHLLTDDLEKLEARVARTSRWRRQRGGDLLETIADFLRSELNLLIAEKVADRSGSSDAATQEVEAHFSGLVDATYINRSTSALRGALTRLYGSELLEPAASLCGLVALAAAIQYGFGFHDGSAWLTVLASMAVGAVAWVALEWMTQRRIARHFQADFGKRVVQQLGEDGSVKRWRVGMAAALPTVALLAVMATGALPPVRAHLLAQDYVRHGLKADLSAFMDYAPNPDVRLRKFPLHAPAVALAEQGDQRAKLTVAWQLLLGEGAEKDVAEAAKWLEQATPLVRKDDLWKTAKAVQILNQDAMPDDLRVAEQLLQEAIKQNSVEARYWLARLYLPEQSPLRDPRRGLQLLTQAADRKHAHAALLLGETYASGKGVERNVHAARRYLKTALDLGLQQAEAELKKLP